MIKVLIVDDSAVTRLIMTKILSKYENIEIVGTAADVYVARDKIVKLRPHVITLDISMPKMDGLSFLAKLMQHYPMPVVVFSSFAIKDSEIALKAMDLGAVEVFCKPGEESAKDVYENLAKSIQIAGLTQIIKDNQGSPSSFKESETKPVLVQTTKKVIAIGASTGGTKAIEAVLTTMSATSPGIVITQHMPEKFTDAFAKRLDKNCRIEVREARNDDDVVPGVALIAPGNNHMLLKQNNGGYVVKIVDGPRVQYQRPSVDVMFRSVAESAGANAVGALLTGMGADGADGLLAMHQKGAFTIAQDEKTCVVFGMPKKAIELNAVDQVVPLTKISQALNIGPLKGGDWGY